MNKISISTEERQRLIDNASRHGDIDALMVKNWIKDLNYIVENIILGNFNIPYLEGTLWIRLFGLLTEIRDNYEYVSNNILPLVNKNTDPAMKEVIKLTKEIYDEIINITNELTEDEHLVIDYLRQTNCHVLQKGFRLGIKTKNDKRILKERYTISSNKKTYLVSEIDSSLDKIFRSYSGHQGLMARDICLKIKKRINKICIASEKRASL